MTRITDGCSAKVVWRAKAMTHTVAQGSHLADRGILPNTLEIFHETYRNLKRPLEKP
jgi:hypothetical protein